MRRNEPYLLAQNIGIFFLQCGDAVETGQIDQATRNDGEPVADACSAVCI